MVLWSPDESLKNSANITRFMADLRKRHGVPLETHGDLFDWSIREPDLFWRSVLESCAIQYSGDAAAVLEDRHRMPGARWFPGIRLNFARNLLRFSDDRPAVVSWGEDLRREVVTFGELQSKVSKLQAFLRTAGLKPGDNVAAFVPNIPDTIVAMLATTSLGASWSSCSPDFGVSGVLDRFAQVEPKILFCADGYFFKGAKIDSLGRVRQVLGELKSVARTVVMPFISEKPDLRGVPNGESLVDIYNTSGDTPLSFPEFPFAHPLYIMFSSGTTGKPKCIVHSAGGTLLEHLKELILHTNLKQQDRIFYQTTCGWMMWNWLVSSLAVGVTVVLYDGSPLQRGSKILFDLAQDEKVTIFGTNAKFIALCEKEGLRPIESHDLSSLHTILSTGSPLLPENFEYVYSSIKKNV
ncbi:MAG: acetoacetate--CoA ligase, partial [Proteobacteria bacterium]